MIKIILKTFVIFSLVVLPQASFAAESSSLLIDNIVVEKDGREIKQPIPIKDFFEMVMERVRAWEDQIRASGQTPINTITVDRTLSIGDFGPEVVDLQKLLNTSSETQVASEGPGSPGMETSYFGPLTRAAVLKFQGLSSEEGIIVNGIADEATRAKLNSLFVR